MAKILVWDSPTRLFHLLLTMGIVTAFAIAQFTSKRGELFPYHMLIGIVLGGLLLLRIVWGLVGTRYARFSALQLKPADLVNYLRSVVSSRRRHYTGHNPGSSYAIVAILALTLVVVGSGLMMSNGSEAAEEVHEAAAYALLAVSAVHVVGVLWYSYRQKEHISWSMLTGKKEGTADEAIPSSRPLAALVLLGCVAFLAGGLLKSYDKAKHETRLPLVNVGIHLGEGEHH